MRGLDPRTHHFRKLFGMDCRVEPGNDEKNYVSISNATSKFGAEWVSAPAEA
jgi:hypothetical protein